MTAAVAMCVCGQPLVMTFAFRGQEFVCADDGRLYRFLEPAAAESTPELLTRAEEQKHRWQELSAGLIGDGVHLTGCADCATSHHWVHASAAEREADGAARARMAAHWRLPA